MCALSIYGPLCATAGAQDAPGIRSQQEFPAASPTPPPSSSRQSLDIPGAEPRQTLEIALPSGFVGCWEGTINGFDSLEPIAFLSSLSQGTTTTYQFCYRPIGSGGYRMDLTKLKVKEEELKVVSFENRVIAVDHDHGMGKLRNRVVTEQTSYLLWLIPITIAMEIEADEEVTLVNRDLVRMRYAADEVERQRLRSRHIPRGLQTLVGFLAQFGTLRFIAPRA